MLSGPAQVLHAAHVAFTVVSVVPQRCIQSFRCPMQHKNVRELHSSSAALWSLPLDTARAAQERAARLKLLPLEAGSTSTSTGSNRTGC